MSVKNALYTFFVAVHNCNVQVRVLFPRSSVWLVRSTGAKRVRFKEVQTVYSNVSLLCFRFRIDNTDHIIDVNKGNMPFEYDQVNIVCPVYAPGTHESDAEKYIIYNVSVPFC